MRTIYNGVDLGVLKTNFLEFSPVYDNSGSTYLYTRLAAHFRCVVNGQAEVITGSANGPFLSYEFSNDNPISNPLTIATRPTPNDPVPVTDVLLPNIPGPTATVPIGTGVTEAPTGPRRAIIRKANKPNLTLQTVRNRLCSPRGQWYVFAGPGQEQGNPDPNTKNPPDTSAVLLAAIPNPGTTCDPKLGPKPQLLGIYEALGDAATLIVDWACEGFLLESDTNYLNPRGVLLSNKFVESHSVDEDSYTTTSVVGEAIFRADQVFKDGIMTVSPDAFRPVIFMPIPQGFVRENISVSGMADAVGVYYNYEDRQVASNFVAAPYVAASKINVLHRMAMRSGDVWDTVSGFAGMAANTLFAAAGLKDLTRKNSSNNRSNSQSGSRGRRRRSR